MNNVQVVFASIWSNKIWTFDGSTRVEFTKLADAREWALQRGKAIKVRPPGLVKGKR